MGCGEEGSITALLTVLVEGDDMNDPVADCVRSILDGHILLSRSLAEQNHYPAIDVLASVSRTATRVAAQEHLDLSGAARRLLATYAAGRDLIDVGAYQRGRNQALDRAVALKPRLDEFLRQSHQDASELSETLRRLSALVGKKETP